MDAFDKKQGLTIRPKFDDVVVKNNEATSLVAYVSKYLRHRSPNKKLTSPRDAEKQIKQIYDIIRG